MSLLIDVDITPFEEYRVPGCQNKSASRIHKN
jgi:hypothetical protein